MVDEVIEDMTNDHRPQIRAEVVAIAPLDVTFAQVSGGPSTS
jgi:hypothetical protein